MYWSAFLSVFAGATAQTSLRSPMGTYVLHHRRATEHAELFDPKGLPVKSWTGVSWHQAKNEARAWLDDAALALGHNPLHDDLYYAQRQGLA